MSDPQSDTPVAINSREDTLRKITIFDYALHIASPIVSMMLLSLIAVGINYVKKPDAIGSVFESHMDYMIRTFWWTALWLVVAAVGGFVFGLITLGIGFALYAVFMALPVLWYLYRMISGLLRALDNRPI